MPKLVPVNAFMRKYGMRKKHISADIFERGEMTIFEAGNILSEFQSRKKARKKRKEVTK